MDGSLRELERRARASSDAVDVHAYLQALVRSGAAPLDRAPLLAWLTDEPPPDARTLASELCAHGPQAIARGALAAAEALAQVWHAHAPPEHAARPGEALAATRAWLACPCDSHAADCAVTAEAALVAAQDVQADAVATVPHEPTPDDVDPCDLDPLDAELTAEPRAAFEDVGDRELLARLRRACEAREPVDAELLEECRDRAGEEAVLEVTGGTALVEGLDAPDVPSSWRPRAEPGEERSGDPADAELPTLDRRVVTLVLVDPVAELAAAAATACAGDKEAQDELEGLLGTALERATSTWTLPELDLDEADDPLLLGSPLIGFADLASVVLAALRRWAMELPPVAAAEADPPAPRPRERPRSRPRRAREEEEELPREAQRLAQLAWLGHPGAVRRHGVAPPADLDAWARGLASFGAGVCGQAALATARAAHEALESASRLPPGPRRALGVLEAWLARPGAAEAAAARGALDRCVDAMCAAEAAPAAKAEELAALALELALVEEDRLGEATAAVLVASAEVVGPPTVRRAVAQALAPALLAPEGP